MKRSRQVSVTSFVEVEPSLKKKSCSSDGKETLETVLLLNHQRVSSRILSELTLEELGRLGGVSKGCLKSIVEHVTSQISSPQLFYSFYRLPKQTREGNFSASGCYQLPGSDLFPNAGGTHHELIARLAEWKDNFRRLGNLLRTLTCTFFSAIDRVNLATEVIVGRISVLRTRLVESEGEIGPQELMRVLFLSCEAAFLHSFADRWNPRDCLVAMERVQDLDPQFMRLWSDFCRADYSLYALRNAPDQILMRAHFFHLYWSEISPSRRGFWLHLVLAHYAGPDPRLRARLLFLVFGALNLHQVAEWGVDEEEEEEVGVGRVHLIIGWEDVGKRFVANQDKSLTEELFKPLADALSALYTHRRPRNDMSPAASYKAMLLHLFGLKDDLGEVGPMWNESSIAALVLFTCQDLRRVLIFILVRCHHRLEISTFLSQLIVLASIYKMQLEPLFKILADTFNPPPRPLFDEDPDEQDEPFLDECEKSHVIEAVWVELIDCLRDFKDSSGVDPADDLTLAFNRTSLLSGIVELGQSLMTSAYPLDNAVNEN